MCFLRLCEKQTIRSRKDARTAEKGTRKPIPGNAYYGNFMIDYKRIEGNIGGDLGLNYKSKFHHRLFHKLLSNITFINLIFK